MDGGVVVELGDFVQQLRLADFLGELLELAVDASLDRELTRAQLGGSGVRMVVESYLFGGFQLHAHIGACTSQLSHAQAAEGRCSYLLESERSPTVHSS